MLLSLWSPIVVYSKVNESAIALKTAKATKRADEIPQLNRYIKCELEIILNRTFICMYVYLSTYA